MANQITHIALAEKVYEQQFKSFDRREFMIGVVFPDIRYLGVIRRDQTHETDRSLELVLKSETAFRAGMRYHALTDRVREQFMAEQYVYDMVPESKHITRAIKCLEDEVIYPTIQDWPTISQYLNDIIAEQVAFGINEASIKKWHGLLQDYFAVAPNDVSRSQLVAGLGYPDVAAEEINELVATMKQKPKVLEIINQLFERWPQLLIKS